MNIGMDHCSRNYLGPNNFTVVIAGGLLAAAAFTLSGDLLTAVTVATGDRLSVTTETAGDLLATATVGPVL
jgi:hypothetical protein